jgi:hypothetical protein
MVQACPIVSRPGARGPATEGTPTDSRPVGALLVRQETVKGSTMPCCRWGMPSFASGTKQSPT